METLPPWACRCRHLQLQPQECQHVGPLVVATLQVACPDVLWEVVPSLAYRQPLLTSLLLQPVAACGPPFRQWLQPQPCRPVHFQRLLRAAHQDCCRVVATGQLVVLAVACQAWQPCLVFLAWVDWEVVRRQHDLVPNLYMQRALIANFMSYASSELCTLWSNP